MDNLLISVTKDGLLKVAETAASTAFSGEDEKKVKTEFYVPILSPIKLLSPPAKGFRQKSKFKSEKLKKKRRFEDYIDFEASDDKENDTTLISANNNPSPERNLNDESPTKQPRLDKDKHSQKTSPVPGTCYMIISRTFMF